MCALMCKFQGFVAMKVIYHVPVEGCVQFRDLPGAVVVIAAQQDRRLRCEGPDASDAFPRDLHPGLQEPLLRHFVQKVKGDPVRHGAISRRKAFPQAEKEFLVPFVLEKALLPLLRVERKTLGLVEIQHGAELVFSAPVHDPVEKLQTFADQRSVRPLDHVVVHRDPDMVQSPVPDHGEILFRDEAA